MKRKRKTKLWEWQERCKSGTEKCSNCHETRHLTVDHVVPVHILEMFTLKKDDILYNMEENFEILCIYCNKRKAGTIDARNPKTYTILSKVMNQAKDYHLPNLSK